MTSAWRILFQIIKENFWKKKKLRKKEERKNDLIFNNTYKKILACLNE